MMQIGDIIREDELMFIKRKTFANSIKLSDNAPEGARKWLKELRQEFMDGKHDDTINAMCSALEYKISREGL
jgi:hypothetical protein